MSNSKTIWAIWPSGGPPSVSPCSPNRRTKTAGATSTIWPRSWPSRWRRPPTGASWLACAIARFPYRRTIEEFDYDFQPSVDRKLVSDLATLRFIAENRAVLFLGQPGCGKTHLAVALAIAAVEAGYRGYFSTADDMAHALVQARRDGTFAVRLRAYTAPTVLVLDDLGLLPVPPGGAAEIFHVINTRYQRGHPTLVTTNRGLPEWGEVFGDPVVAGAILDRLMHRAVVFNIKGPSWRMKEHHALATASRASADDDDSNADGRRRR